MRREHSFSPLSLSVSLGVCVLASSLCKSRHTHRHLARALFFDGQMGHVLLAFLRLDILVGAHSLNPVHTSSDVSGGRNTETRNNHKIHSPQHTARSESKGNEAVCAVRCVCVCWHWEGDREMKILSGEMEQLTKALEGLRDDWEEEVKRNKIGF